MGGGGEDLIEVQYIGDPNPLDETMKARIILGEIPRSAANVIRGAAIKRSKAIKKVSRRIVDPITFDTSQTYVFGPHDFVVTMDVKDFKKIKESTSGHQFIRVGDPMNKIILPRNGENNILFVEGSKQEFGFNDIEEIKQSIRGRRR